jgi:GAF domain-containing protein
MRDNAFNAHGAYAEYDPSSPAGLALASSQLLAVLMQSSNVDGFLDEAARLAAGVVTPPVACGITFRRDGQPYTAAASEALAAQVDEIQYRAGEGPCLEAMRANHIVEVTDLTGDDRWDGYRPRAIAHGVASSLSFPLTVDGTTAGALNLYATKPDAFLMADRDHSEAFSGQVARALTLMLRQARQAELTEQLQQAMSSRAIIDQAIGILMGEQRCNAATAFDLLRKASQHRNRKLRDVAADIITTVSGEPPQSPPSFRLA